MLPASRPAVDKVNLLFEAYMIALKHMGVYRTRRKSAWLEYTRSPQRKHFKIWCGAHGRAFGRIGASCGSSEQRPPTPQERSEGLSV